MIRRLLAAGCLGVLLASAQAQELRPKVDGKTELRLASVPEPGQAGREEIDLFLSLNPDITLKQTDGISVEGVDQSRLFLGMAAGSAPDVFYGSIADVLTYHHQNFLAPVTDLYERDKAQLLPIKESLKPILYQDGELIAVPQFYKVMALAMRKDMLEERLGESGDRAPKDWDEWFDWALKLTVPEKGIYGLALYGGTWIFEIYVWLAGGEMIEPVKYDPKDGSMVHALPGYGPQGQILFPEPNPITGSNLEKVPLTWRTTVDQTPGVRALNFYKRLLWAQWIRPQDSGEELIFVDYPDLDTGLPVVRDEVRDPKTGRLYRLKRGTPGKPRTDRVVDDTGKELPFNFGAAKIYFGKEYGSDFIEGRVAMMPVAGGRDAVFDSQYSPALVALSTFPPGPAPEGKEATEVNAGLLCMNASTTDPDVRDAAWRYILFCNGTQRQALKVKEWVEDGLAAYVMPEMLTKYGYDAYVDEVPKQWVEQNKKLEAVAKPEAAAPGFRAAFKEIDNAMQTVFVDPNIDSREQLAKRAAYINRYILEEDREATLSKLRPYSYALGILVLIGLFFIMRSFWKSVSSMASARSTAPGASKARLRTHFFAWLMMIPALALIFAFDYIPMVKGSVMAFQEYYILGERTFIGMDNFISVLTSPSFWQSVGVTFRYVALSLGLGFLAPVILALLLSELPRFRYFFRTVYFLPAVTSGFVITLLWKQFFDPSPIGLANRVLAPLGMGPFSWLQDPGLAMFCIIIPGVWASAGPGCLLYLAALTTVSDDLYEASELDGASWLQKIWNVTLPTIFPLMIINFLGAFIGAFHSTGNILVMTGGGPDRATTVVGLDIWFNAFVYLKFGYATAMAWVLGACLIGFVVLQMRLLKRMEFRTTDAK